MLARHLRLWVFITCVLARGTFSKRILLFWGEGFMSRDRGATLSQVVGNIVYAKAPVSRRGIKLVAQNREGARGEGEKDRAEKDIVPQERARRRREAATGP